MSEPQIYKGLAGVVVDVTAVSRVMPETNSLTYRGYAVEELTKHCSFEEVAYLLLHGELPGPTEFALFSATERGGRTVPGELYELLALLPVNAHPMDTVRTALSWLGARSLAEAPEATMMEQAYALLAQTPTVVAADFRRRRGKEPIAPRGDLPYSENFFYMCFGDVPAPEIVSAFDASMTLYAEHSFNASTFTARVVTSTMADLFSALTAAVGALKGPLHGGANEAVMHMMLEIDDPAQAADWLRGALERKEKIMGFGHRVYKTGDSRVPTMHAALKQVAAATGGQKWLRMYDELSETMVAEKGIHPNLDFPAGPTYYLMGFDIPMFTPIFVMSRVTGWAAHVMEQAGANALIRPLSHYVGPAQRGVVPLAER